MEELVKKEPVTPSQDTTSSSRLVTLEARKVPRSPMKKKPVISSPTSRNLVVLDIHTASGNSSQTSSDSEIEKLDSQATPPKKIWISKFREKGSSEKSHRERIHSKEYRKQKLKAKRAAEGSYNEKKSLTPRITRKCFKCGKRSHLRTKCENKDGTLINIRNELVSTSEPRVQASQADVPKAKSAKPKKEVTVNDLRKKSKKSILKFKPVKKT